MTCAACSSRIEKVLSRFQGVNQVHINLATETAYLEYSTADVSIADIISRVEKIGYKASIQEKKSNNQDHRRDILAKKREFLFAALLSLPLLWSMAAHFSFTSFIPVPSLLANPWIQFMLATPIQFVIGRAFYTGAFYAIRNKTPNMDVLVVLGTSAAYFYSIYLAYEWSTVAGGESSMTYFETGAFLITFIKMGKWLEALTKGRTGLAIEKLVNLQVKTATVIRNGKDEQIPIELLRIDDVIRIKPGERIPVDGELLTGSTYVDQSMLTGESIPVKKEPGDPLIGATLNKNGSVTYRVNKRLEDTVLNQIIRMVREAQGSKAPIQRVADVISEFFVQIVVCIAIATFIIWYVWLTSQDLGLAMQAAISVLVIACPCALGLATPTSIMVGSGRAAEHGILFKRGEQLERLHKTDTIVFDKTGTLTVGKPVMTDAMTFEGDVADILTLAASAEKLSEHPVASALVQAALEKGHLLQEVNDFNAVSGMGIEAFVHGQAVIVGTRNWLKMNQIDYTAGEEQIMRLELEGKTVVLVAINHTFAGLFAVADELRDSAVEAISQLRSMGKEVIMLTGDHMNAARIIANKAGIDQVIAGVLPEGKAQVIRDLRKARKKVLMVGDGINDAPALATANFSLALSNGTDVAIEAADLTLVTDNLMRIPHAIEISRRTIKNIKQNLVASLLYNAIAIPIAMSGMLMPWVAGAAMALSSVSVILNALRLQKISMPAHSSQGGKPIEYV
ncbi:copper-translocating P-type ATPase [Paenibacillus sp. SYP-B3998]|uniref:P-type Cu(+) transporter n=2 Tax=Paenibacillus sp. SYP-B3998 TaxID=2678564 RepID=A0A6G3ZU67_9BACL|nr:heavy metal translocating P-type ATPase [Paenibacillus sp. SYP-B3998]NEW05682.1 copper-translocating P-type ATPase [Paenibacillus sp. SYP-B3998]